MKYILSLLAFLVLSIPAVSYAQTAQKNTLDSVLAFSKSKEPLKAKTYLTPRSYGLYDRIYAQDLLFLLPQDTQAKFYKRQNDFDYVRFTDVDGDSNEYVLMAFEDDTEAQFKKLDLPETFRVGLGENWQDALNLIEQTYVWMRQKYGAEKSRQIVEQMIKKPIKQ